ncbi:IS21-like element helper ATPase IstB [uncultured Sphaerochaeta sp.]|uniref:IS21-like element helper ATPase IstB n=1 Tax=uncultured Sphaerochaeta sp. TaxID=886478 RepID=UPI002A0A6D50|nr:IS21-like element helper ATPase IstB [uncultured Sphaerochaeta sp.]
MRTKQARQELSTVALTTRMRKFFFSRESIQEALETGTPKQLEYLDGLLGSELGRRAETRKIRMVKHAGFPSIKHMDDYDFSNVRFPALMGKEEVLSLDFIKQRRTLIFYGICGSGKTMLSIALGIMACNQGYSVRFMTMNQLVARLARARSEGLLERTLSELKKLDMLIIDEWGYCQIGREDAQLLFRVIADSYETKSLIVTTNLPFSEWGKLMTDEQLATAIIDRLVHYGHLIDMGTKDWRLEHSLMRDQVVTITKGKESQKV